MAPTCHARHDQFTQTLFAKVLQRNLDALIEKLLIVAAKLVAAIGATVEERGHHAHRSMRLPLELGCAAYVDSAVEIEVVDIVVGLRLWPTPRPSCQRRARRRRSAARTCAPDGGGRAWP